MIFSLSNWELKLKSPLFNALLKQQNISQQAKHVANLIFIQRTTNWTKCDRKCYLITTSWFNKWAEYVDFHKEFNMKKIQLGSVYNQPEDDMQSFSTKEYPGEIYNQSLLANERDFYHNYNHLKALCNFGLRDLLEKHRDYNVVSKDIWNYFWGIYGGFEISRDCIPIGANGKISPDITMSKVIFILTLKVKIVFIRKYLTQCDPPKRIYFYSNFTFRQLKFNIIQMFKFLHSKTADQLRLWKLSGAFSDFMKYYRIQRSLKVILTHQ